MTDDWPQIKARLERAFNMEAAQGNPAIIDLSDIRAALQRVEELEIACRENELAERLAAKRAEAAEARVEELERESERGWDQCSRQRRRAESAEAEVKRLEGLILNWEAPGGEDYAPELALEAEARRIRGEKQ